MQVPIKWNPPWRSKYIRDETFLLNDWMIFGTYDDGTVGICDGDADIFERVPKDVAEEICEARRVFCDKMQAIMNLGTRYDPLFSFETGLPVRVRHLNYIDEHCEKRASVVETLPKEWTPVDEIRVALGLTHRQMRDEVVILSNLGKAEFSRKGDALDTLLIRRRW